MADIVLEIPPGQSVWPESCHEPLIFALCLPFLPYSPWQLCQTPALLEMERSLHLMWKEGKGTEGIALHKLWEFQRSVPSMPKGLVQKMLQDEHIFKEHANPDKCMVAKEGDWLCAPFQCDFCWFQNLKGQDADPSSLSDHHLLDHIRQLHPAYPPRGPWPLGDKVGFK
eukprot:14534778-Ditylum_brightwellii.AAC.1